MNILSGEELRIEAGRVTGTGQARAIAYLPEPRAVATIRGVGVSAKTGNVALLRTEHEN